MPKQVPDSTRRFPSRPLYTRSEIEGLAAQVLIGSSSRAGISIRYPIDDDFLFIIVEMLTEKFDYNADLSRLILDVDGYTQFSRHSKPTVLINRDLNEARFHSRRRMTVAHELGHVVLHEQLHKGNELQLNLLVEEPDVPIYCSPFDIARSTDWCEWQAGYFGGALLVPAAEARRVLEVGDPKSLNGGIPDDSIAAHAMVRSISSGFAVSRDAARVRLSQMSLIVGKQQSLLEDQA